MKRCPQKSHKGITGGAGREGVVGGTVGSSIKGGGRRGNRRFLYV